MKTAGMICTILGALSFIGAAFAGHNALGPSFWLALGIFLLYKAKNKERNNGSDSK